MPKRVTSNDLTEQLGHLEFTALFARWRTLSTHKVICFHFYCLDLSVCSKPLGAQTYLMNTKLVHTWISLLFPTTHKIHCGQTCCFQSDHEKRECVLERERERGRGREVAEEEG